MHAAMPLAIFHSGHWKLTLFLRASVRGVSIAASETRLNFNVGRIFSHNWHFLVFRDTISSPMVKDIQRNTCHVMHKDKAQTAVSSCGTGKCVCEAEAWRH